ncbi:hypothetical protein N9O24_01000 [bacterium]|nr:hypothetical protein [bacterium]
MTTATSSRRCDDPLGAVRLALGPSYYTPDPKTGNEASIVIQVASLASEAPLSSTNVQQPSPRQYPSARQSNVWHRPSPDSIPAAEKAKVTPSVSNPMPAAAACGH